MTESEQLHQQVTNLQNLLDFLESDPLAEIPLQIYKGEYNGIMATHLQKDIALGLLRLQYFLAFQI